MLAMRKRKTAATPSHSGMGNVGMYVRRRHSMRYVCALLILGLAPLARPADNKGKKAASVQAITGWLEVKSDYYVMHSEDLLKELAVLEPVGFDKTLFARFVSHKVTVTGELVTSTDPPTLRVKSYGNIKNISDTCAPG